MASILFGSICGGSGCACGCQATFAVTCGATPAAYATVTVKSGSTTVATGYTNSAGQVTLNIGTAGTYTVTATGSTCSSFSGSYNLSCGGTYPISCCTPSCDNCNLGTLYPTIYITDSSQTTALTWDGSAWTGCYQLMMTTSFNPCTCSDTTGGLTRQCCSISYQVYCIDPDTIEVDRFWLLCDVDNLEFNNCGYCCDGDPATGACGSSSVSSCAGEASPCTRAEDSGTATLSSCDPFPSSVSLVLTTWNCSNGGVVPSPLSADITINS